MTTTKSLLPLSSSNPRRVLHVVLGLLFAVLSVIAVASLWIGITNRSANGSNYAQTPPSPIMGDHAPYTQERITAAKNETCHQLELARIGIAKNTHTPGTVPNEPALGRANVANGRISIVIAASVLNMQIDPATPDDLADAVRAFTNAAGKYALEAITEKNDPETAKRLNIMNVAGQEAEKMCDG